MLTINTLRVTLRSMDAIRKAIEAAGGPTALAKRLHVRQSVVSNWLLRGSIPADRCIPVEEAIDGAVTRYELRPDVFGDAPAESQAA